MMGSFDFFERTAPRKTVENTAKHHDGGVGSVVANHRGGSESSVVVTLLQNILPHKLSKPKQKLLWVHVCFCCVCFSFSVLSQEIGWDVKP